ncbi:MAG: glycosyl hydrolase family 79 C-terminal domain-containing protein [Solirubrobacteraceae bacterium]
MPGLGSILPRPARGRAGRGSVLAALVLLVAVVAVATALVVRDAGRQGPPGTVTPPAATISGVGAAQAHVSVAAGATPVIVPRSFLGISTEYWTIPVWGAHLPLLNRVLSLLSADGPLRLRIGGDSADSVFWAPVKELPEWVFELTPAWLTQVSRLVRLAHVRLILDLNLVTATPQVAARWARTAEAKLPRGSIIAFEIGNEPDIYSQSSWRQRVTGPTARRLPTQITATSYARAYASYARALAQAAPGVPLLAPALAEPQKNSSWVAKLLAAPHPGLTGVTAHRYPYSACSRPGTATFPTIARVLSENATAGLARTALSVEKVSDRAKLPLWLTEINSVTCGGTRGVSNTYATALWAPDALLELVKAGVESASIHVRHNAINMAFSLTRRGLVAHPLLYGMILFARTLGPGAQLLPLQVNAPSAAHLKAWAVQINGGIVHVLLLDKGGRPAQIRLSLPSAVGVGTVQRLLAPSVASTSHVTLGGQRLGADGAWHGTPSHETIAPGPDGYRVTLPRYSAALLTLHLR